MSIYSPVAQAAITEAERARDQPKKPATPRKTATKAKAKGKRARR